jgi:phosphohistidine swiveling domain-containing protein
MSVKLKLDTSLIIPLADLSPLDAARAGAKAANEAALLQAGFSVPEGFVLATQAFERFLTFNDIGFSGEPEAIANATMPHDITEALEYAAAALGDGPLAVRSSAVAEDLPGASFAGQYETSLDVRGHDELETAVRRCWASLYSEQVVAYRQQQGIEASSMAVLIQQMVPAEAAGVVFTTNPVTGARDEVIINAVRGLGERLVSGEASPDEWVVRDRDAHCQRAPEEAISAEQARIIAEMARRVEEHFSRPQDLEWAIADEQLYLLQARPITTLPEKSSQTIEMIPVPVEIPPGYWIRNASHQPQPTTPMHRSVFGKYVRAAAMQMFNDFGLLIEGFDMQDIGGWEYIRMVPLGGKDGPTLPAWMMWLLVRTVPMIRRRIQQSVKAVRTDIAGDFMQRWYAEWQDELATRIVELRDVDLERLSDQELADHLDAVEGLFRRAMEIRGPHHISEAIILYEFVSNCEELLGWDEQQSFKLVSGTSFKSTEPARRLNELAQIAQARPAVRALVEDLSRARVERLAEVDAEFAAAFDAYMKEYGCRALRYEVADPTLLETPSLVLDLVRGQLVRGFDPDSTQDILAQRRTAAETSAHAALEGRSGDLARFEHILERARYAYPVREDSEYYCVSAPVALLRYALLRIGERLVDLGVIERRDDVFFLGINEARSAFSNGGDCQALIKRRKGERAWAVANPGPPSYGPEPSPPPSLDFLPAEARLVMEAMMWYFDPEEELASASQSGSSLTGTAVSPGEYTGPVRVIMHEGEFHKLQPGDVLVCPTTSPVWSVLFPSIGALVTDTGAILSHPAIIAREYQVPAVVALGDATSRLQDGQMVTVNGSAGTVTAAS